jgi:hypothetical protein
MTTEIMTAEQIENMTKNELMSVLSALKVKTINSLKLNSCAESTLREKLAELTVKTAPVLVPAPELIDEPAEPAVIAIAPAPAAKRVPVTRLLGRVCIEPGYSLIVRSYTDIDILFNEVVIEHVSSVSDMFKRVLKIAQKFNFPAHVIKRSSDKSVKHSFLYRIENDKHVAIAIDDSEVVEYSEKHARALHAGDAQLMLARICKDSDLFKDSDEMKALRKQAELENARSAHSTDESSEKTVKTARVTSEKKLSQSEQIAALTAQLATLQAQITPALAPELVPVAEPVSEVSESAETE